MNRLRDEEPLDRVSARGIEILHAVEGAPRPPEMKGRVWAALQGAPETPAAGLRPRVLRALVLGAGIVAFASATALGAIGGRWISDRIQQRRAVAVASRLVSPSHERPALTRRVEEAAMPPAAEPGAPVAVEPEPVRAQVPRLHPVAAPPARERTQVLDALIALRRDHDPERAQALLDRYLETSRQGALREEALVLAIEAADARHDPARAARLAGRYRDEFPSGRFTTFVQSHIRP